MKAPKFTIQEMNGTTVLKKDANVCLCPFRTPYYTPSSIQGQMNINQPICSSGCQFFEIQEKQGIAPEVIVNLECAKFYVMASIEKAPNSLLS